MGCEVPYETGNCVVWLGSRPNANNEVAVLAAQATRQEGVLKSCLPWQWFYGYMPLGTYAEQPQPHEPIERARYNARSSWAALLGAYVMTTGDFPPDSISWIASTQ